MILNYPSDAKDVENRSWRTHLRGTIVVHASKKIDYEAVSNLRSLGYALPEHFPTGGFVGITTITDCIEARSCRSRWAAADGFAFKLKDSKPFPRLIPGNGALYFFAVPDFVQIELERIGFKMKGRPAAYAAKS